MFLKIYTKIAIWFTKWENYRTKTEYDDALIIKLFLFEFVNSYGSLFYMAFFRNVSFILLNCKIEYQYLIKILKKVFFFNLI